MEFTGEPGKKGYSTSASTQGETASTEELTVNAQELANMAENLDKVIAKFEMMHNEIILETYTEL
jgi:hypothetical protein